MSTISPEMYRIEIEKKYTPKSGNENKDSLFINFFMSKLKINKLFRFPSKPKQAYYYSII